MKWQSYPIWLPFVLFASLWLVAVLAIDFVAVRYGQGHLLKTLEHFYNPIVLLAFGCIYASWMALVEKRSFFWSLFWGIASALWPAVGFAIWLWFHFAVMKGSLY